MPLVHLWICLAVLLSGACLCAAARAGDDTPGSLDERLLADAGDRLLDDFDLPSACLIAGGVRDPDELARVRAALDAAAATVAVPALAGLSAEQRAEAIFQRLHGAVLVGRYDKRASDLRLTLAQGDFNCLSALVVYWELCRRAGVPLEIWSQPGHVDCRLPGRPDLRIEPTSRQWPSGPLRPATSGAAPRQITPVELLGRFYYNRGVELLTQDEYERGVELLQVACRLDPHDADARANLLAGLNNWALALDRQQNRSAAAALVARGLAIDPAFGPLVANERYLRQRGAGR